MRAWEKWSTVALALVLGLLFWTAAPAAGHARAGRRSVRRAAPRAVSVVPTITLTASRRQITSGFSAKVSGVATGVVAGTQVRLYQSRYPFRSAKLVQTTVTAADLGFSFSISPDRDSRYVVQLAGTAARAQVAIGVGGKTKTTVTALPLGRAEVTILVYHPSDLLWGHAPVLWSYGNGSQGRFSSAPSTRSIRLGRNVAMLRSTITLPAGPFRWRACLHVPQAQALLNPRRPPGCHGRGYYGGGRLPFGYPSPSAVARAASYLGGRIGRTAFAVVDSEGRLSGVNIHRTFVSASVVKAMLLVAYLRRLDSRGQHFVDSTSNSFLYPMINVSDNNAATHTWSIVGNSGLYAMARTAGMTDYSVSTDWASSQISAADQARFFFEMDSLIPREFVGYARRLLSTIAGFESWGIPAVGRPRGYTVFFKGGWRGTSLGQLVHQIGRLEGHHVTFSIAVMTDGDPSMGYGISTIQGVTSALL